MVMLLPSSREDSEDDSDHDQANLERSIDSLGPSVQRDQSGIVLDGSCPTSPSYTDPPEIPSATNRSINSARRLPGIWRECGKFTAIKREAAAGDSRCGRGRRVSTEYVSNTACPLSPRRKPLSAFRVSS